MDTLWLWLHRFLSFYFSLYCFLLSLIPNIIKSFSIFSLIDATASLYFRFCHLSPCTVDLDEQTTIHFWSTNHRRFNKPNLVLIHGYGANSRWQFLRQVRPLSHRFNLYVPDLLFFGESYTQRKDRTEEFQAHCVCQGLRSLGVDRFSIYGISYGGYVAYRMAETRPGMVEKVVIVSSGIGATEEQIEERLKKIGRNVVDLLLPEKPEDLRHLMNFTMYKFDPFKWVPNILLKDFINMTCKNQRKEKQQLLEHLLPKKLDSKPIPLVTKETLLIWGDKDNVFPLSLAYQLQRQLGPKSKLEIMKDTGHAANIDSPHSLNELIIQFVSAGPSASASALPENINNSTTHETN